MDVRDVASGCLLAAEKGRKGECYILSDKHCEIREVLDIAGEVSGEKETSGASALDGKTGRAVYAASFQT